MAASKVDVGQTEVSSATKVRRWIRARQGGILATPAVLFILIMMVIPIIFTIWLSFVKWSGGAAVGPEWVSFDNYTRIFSDDRFRAALTRTLFFTVVAVAVETVLGVSIATLLNREFFARGLVRTLFLLPMVATPVAIALVFRLMYEPNLGVINQIFRGLGIGESDLIADSSLAIWMLMLVDIWQWTPIIILIVAASLAAQPSDIYDAAAVDGASPWQTFTKITLPMVRPAIVIAMVFRMIDALKTFDIIWVITSGGPGFATETLNIYIYKQNFEAQNLGYAAAMLNVFFALVVGSAMLLLRYRRTRT